MARRRKRAAETRCSHCRKDTRCGPFLGFLVEYSINRGSTKAFVNGLGGICNHLHVKSLWTTAIVSH